MHIHNTIYIYWYIYIYISVYSYIILISHPEKLPKRSSILDLLDVSQPRRIWGKMFLSLEKYPLKGWNPMNSGNLKVFSSEFWGWSIRFPWWMSCFASTKKLRQLRVKLGHWYMMLLLEQWWSLKKKHGVLDFWNWGHLRWMSIGNEAQWSQIIWWSKSHAPVEIHPK